eukprot:scaffold131376_cov63-Phaeocystis_antarctica.AAC.1
MGAQGGRLESGRFEQQVGYGERERLDAGQRPPVRVLELRLVLVGVRPQPVRRQPVRRGEAEVGDQVQVGQPRHLASQHPDVRVRAWREPTCGDAAGAEHDAATAAAAAAEAAVQRDLRALGSKTFRPLEDLDARHARRREWRVGKFEKMGNHRTARCSLR